MVLAGVHASEQELVRFRKEAEAIARFQHANIVQVHEVGQHNNLSYLAMEYIDGGSLADNLKGPPLSDKQVAVLVRTLARAIQQAHTRGVVHRDLKPANIQFTADGVPKIVDFGLAKLRVAKSTVTAEGQILGTPSYMAPEQAGGHVQEIEPKFGNQKLLFHSHVFSSY